MLESVRYTFTALADNYAVPRGHLRGTLETNHGYDGSSDVIVFEGTPKDAHTGIYVLDFGTHVEVRWVSGYQPKGNRIYLQRFPLSGGIRPDNGREIDMSGWMLGPRTCFHLKLKESK